MLHIKTYNKYSIITIVNWPVYQENEQQMNNSCTSNEHKQELKKELKKEITPELFSSLRERYTDQELIDRCFEAIRSTRKTGKVADSILVAQLRRWERYPPEQVEAGIRTYLDKDCAAQGKREEYLWGIIRNQSAGAGTGKSWRDDLPDL
jgi:hypothetical protein